MRSHNSMRIMRDLLIGVYSAHKPNTLIGYATHENLYEGESIGLFTFGERLKSQRHPSFQTATLLIGGVSPLMFLFARVVELTTSPVLQSMALQILLQTTHSNTDLFTEFQRCDGIGLIGSVLRTKSCVKGLYMLKSIIDVACDGPVIVKKQGSEEFQISNTIACVTHPDLLISVITRYWDWYSIGRYESDVLDLLFLALLALVREKHPHHQLNVFRLSKSGLMASLLNFCKIYLVGASRTVYISKQSAKHLVTLISVFSGSPPPPSLLDEIIKLLLIMHRPSDSFITHDPSKFYFLLTPMLPNKSNKRLSLQMPISITSNNAKRERKLTVPINMNSFYTKIQQLERTTDGLPFDVVSKGEIMEEMDEVIPSRSQQQMGNGSVAMRMNGVRVSPVRGSKKALDILESHHDDGVLNKIMSNMQARERQQNRRKMRRNSRKREKYSKKKSSKRHQDDDDSTTTTTTMTESGIEEGQGTTSATLVTTSTDDSKTVSFHESLTTLESPFGGGSNMRHLEDRFLVYNSEGFIQLQTSLFNLLKDFILILPDSSVQEVLSHYVTVEILIVLSNHKDVKVRTAIIRLLTIMCERLPASVIAQHSKQYYWHHLGNQISLHFADFNLVQSCFQWATGLCVRFDGVSQIREIELTQRYGVNILIAILPQTVHDNELSTQTFDLMQQLYNKVSFCLCFRFLKIRVNFWFFFLFE